MAVPYNTSAALSALMYEISGRPDFAGKTVSEAVNMLKEMGNGHYDELAAMVKQNNLADVVILDVSWSDNSGTYGQNANKQAEMNAATFKFPSPSEDLYIAYRGTGDGNWKYNADSAFGTGPEASAMQEFALKYFDQAYEKYYDGSGKLYVTGHSQGANNAMYVTLASEYASSITNCVSIDGPGFSNELLERLKHDMPGGQAAYERQVDKCYAVYGENDYVHNLGETHIITDPDHFFFVETPTADSFADYHTIYTHMSNGVLNETTSEGPLSQLSQDIVNAMDHLTNQEAYDAAVLAMQLIENANMGNDTITVDFNPLALLPLAPELIDVVTTTLISNPENILPVLHELGIDQMIVDYIVENPLTVCAVVLAVAVFIKPIAITAAAIAAAICLIEAVTELITAIETLAENIKEFLGEAFQAIKNACQAVKNWLRETFEKGVKYAAENPYFKVDTDKLSQYAYRVYRVKSRLSALDRDLNSLYWQVGFLDLWDLLMTDLLTGGTSRLAKVENYLNNSATRFERAERTAQENMGG